MASFTSPREIDDSGTRFDGKLYAIDATTGEVLFSDFVSENDQGESRWVNASPTVDNGVVYIPNYGDGTVAAFGLICLLPLLPRLQPLHPRLRLPQLRCPQRHLLRRQHLRLLRHRGRSRSVRAATKCRAGRQWTSLGMELPRTTSTFIATAR